MKFKEPLLQLLPMSAIAFLRLFVPSLLRSIAKTIIQYVQRPQRNLQILFDHLDNIYFEQETNVFRIADGLSWDMRQSIRLDLIATLKNFMPVHSIGLDEIVTGYYDQCLERYLFERLNREMQNNETCWMRLAQTNKTVGVVDPDHNRECAQKTFIINNPRFSSKEFAKLEISQDGFVVYKDQKISNDDDKVIGIYKSIRMFGFWNAISKNWPIIIARSSKTLRYQIIAGRHRVAALRYLNSIGQIRGTQKIICHIVEMPYDSLVITRPFYDKCKSCDWGGIIDAGKGTHQDFSLREGITVFRGKDGRKDSLQQWKVLAPLFPGAVRGKRYLDVGANRGLFAFKAIEYGANLSIALEPSESFVTFMKEAKNRYQFDQLLVRQGDIFDQVTFEELRGHEVHCVSCLGVIHHLLRIGISKGILTTYDELLDRVSLLARESVFIEFALPLEDTLVLDQFKGHRFDFSQDRFENALSKHFVDWANLGRVRYRKGRFLYYGRKSTSS